MKKTYEETKAQLEEKLSSSAFRHGSSAFRLGLVPVGISDHLPIEIHIASKTPNQLSIASWNLLADEHLYNNFMNITGTTILSNLLISNNQNNSYASDSHNQLYHFFSELAQFLIKKAKGGDITVTDAVLDEFISTENQSSRLTRSRDPGKALLKKQQVEGSRKEIITIFKDQKHPDAHEFKLAIRHSLELIHHIESSDGALRWGNRLNELSSNTTLTSKLSTLDIIALQECSNPTDIKDILSHHEKKITMLTHKLSEHGTDHCALL